MKTRLAAAQLADLRRKVVDRAIEPIAPHAARPAR